MGQLEGKVAIVTGASRDRCCGGIHTRKGGRKMATNGSVKPLVRNPLLRQQRNSRGNAIAEELIATTAINLICRCQQA
jgi:hypothetical protein